MDKPKTSFVWFTSAMRLQRFLALLSLADYPSKHWRFEVMFPIRHPRGVRLVDYLPYSPYWHALNQHIISYTVITFHLYGTAILFFI